MKENEILRAVLQDTGTGWWEADMTRRIFHMSDFLQRLLRYSTPEVGFDEMKSLIPEDDYEALLRSGPQRSPSDEESSVKKSEQETVSLPTVKIRFRIAELFS